MNAVALLAENITKYFGQGRTAVTAVREISLEIYKGEIVLIMGPSGSGKTTLLSMLGALLRPSGGRIAVDGQEISLLSEGKLPDIRLRHFGFIFQDFNLLSALNARENVEVVLNLAGVKGRRARERAEKLLRELDLGDRLEFRPDQLSGGEKQRVAIARALANDPAVILADEPTANLDSRIGHEVMRLLRKIAREQERCVIIVSHDQRIKDIADRVLWLEDGEFRAAAARAEDPVCHMSVDIETTVAATHEGQTYYFCAEGCRAEFLADPVRFVR
ncbi:MAG: ATP-binding cassette domain-containing protein [Chloroflexota bacterium]|nr:MAG: ATP-binding cassette domain-containing protein [Chloroflexota bacterium]